MTRPWNFPPVTVEPSVASDELVGLYQANRSLLLPYTEIPELITALRRVYNERPGQQPQADGVVASVLLQNAVANAPGDFT